MSLKSPTVGVQLFLLCFVQSGLATINYRAIAQAKYVEAFLSDIALFLFSFFIVKKVVQADRWQDGFLYALGGACGALLCIYLTVEWFGQ